MKFSNSLTSQTRYTNHLILLSGKTLRIIDYVTCGFFTLCGPWVYHVCVSYTSSPHCPMVHLSYPLHKVNSITSSTHEGTFIKINILREYPPTSAVSNPTNLDTDSCQVCLVTSLNTFLPYKFKGTRFCLETEH